MTKQHPSAAHRPFGQLSLETWDGRNWPCLASSSSGDRITHRGIGILSPDRVWLRTARGTFGKPSAGPSGKTCRQTDAVRKNPCFLFYRQESPGWTSPASVTAMVDLAVGLNPIDHGIWRKVVRSVPAP